MTIQGPDRLRGTGAVTLLDQDRALCDMRNTNRVGQEEDSWVKVMARCLCSHS